MNRRQVKIFQASTGFWEVFDFETKKTIRLFDTELRAYKFVVSQDYKLIF